MHTTH